MRDTILNNELVKIELYSGVMIVTWKDSFVDLETAKKVVEYRIAASENMVSYPLLSDVKSITEITPEAREFLASRQGGELVSVCGVLTESTFNSILGNIFLLINKPLVPTQLFSSEDKALKWLSTHLEQMEV